MPHKQGGIRGLKYPLIADKSMAIAKSYGVLNAKEGTPYRFVSQIFLSEPILILLEQCLSSTTKVFFDKLQLMITKLAEMCPKYSD